MSTALVHVEAMTPAEIFRPGAIDPILGTIKEEVRRQASSLDISTETNRKAIASLAFKVAKTKTFIDGQRKALVSDEKKRLSAIDAEGKRIWEELESLQTEVRQPLTEWEQAEKNRVAEHESALAEIAGAGTYTQQQWKMLGSEAIQDRIREIETDGHDWEEFATRAAGVKALAIHQMRESLKLAQQAEAEAAELARLRAEAAEREKKEREEAIAREATLKAERAAEAERNRLENERLQAEARAKQAEAKAVRDAQEAKELAERIEKQRIADAQLAERRAQDAAAKAARDREAAVEAERQRALAETKRIQDEAEARERNKKHRARIEAEAESALVSNSPVDAATAKRVIQAIAEGKIKNIKILY